MKNKDKRNKTKARLTPDPQLPAPTRLKAHSLLLSHLKVTKKLWVIPKAISELRKLLFFSSVIHLTLESIKTPDTER